MATRLILVRHGASLSTQEKIVGGHLGCRGLSEEGVAQSEALSKRWAATIPFSEDMPVGGTYSSVMPRAVATASIALSRTGLAPAVPLCELCEIHPGVTDGMSWKQLSGAYGDIDFYGDLSAPIAPKGESWLEMQERSIGALTEIVDRHEGKVVIVFTHKGVVDATMQAWLGVHPIALRSGSRNTGITTWDIAREESGTLGPILLSYNDSAHLDR